MASATTTRTDAIREIMGQVALLHAGQELEAADVRNAVMAIEQQLVEIEAIASGGTIRVPLLTLGEVVARDQYRRKPPQLRGIDGGRP